MRDEEEIIGRLDEFLTQVRPLDELPHSFDDTLIDKLIENITPNDAIIRHTLSLINEEVFAKNGAVTAKILIRLVDKFLTLRVIDFDARLLLRISISLLLLPNHPSVWSDVLALLVNLIKRETEVGRIGELREDLKDIIEWILRRLSEENLSLFVRNLIERLVFVLSQQFIDDFMNYIMTSLSENLSPIIRESYHRILTHFLQIRSINDAKLLEVFIDSVRLNVTMTEASIVFFNEVMKKLSPADALPILLSSQWVLPGQQLNAMVLYMETINDLPNELLTALRVSPLLKLEHFVRVFCVYKSKKDMLTSLPEWIPVVERIFSSPRPPIDLLPDLVHLFAAQFSCSIDEWIPILVLVLRNILNKTIVFVSLLSSYVLSQIVHAKIPWEIIETRVRDGLMSNDWENRDSAVEIVMYSAKRDRPSPLCVHLDEIAKFVPKDGSPYVRASSLRCLDAHSHSLTRQLAHERFLNDSEPQPRLEAARVFRSIPVTSTDDWIFFIRNLTKLLGDADYEVRSEVVTVCDEWMKMGSNDEEMRKRMIDQLSQWTNDSEIGEHVKAVLSLPAETRKDPTIHLLIDMLQSLEMPDDDTIDCY